MKILNELNFKCILACNKYVLKWQNTLVLDQLKKSSHSLWMHCSDMYSHSFSKCCGILAKFTVVSFGVVHPFHMRLQVIIGWRIVITLIALIVVSYSMHCFLMLHQHFQSSSIVFTKFASVSNILVNLLYMPF